MKYELRVLVPYNGMGKVEKWKSEFNSLKDIEICLVLN